MAPVVSTTLPRKVAPPVVCAYTARTALQKRTSSRNIGTLLSDGCQHIESVARLSTGNYDPAQNSGEHAAQGAGAVGEALDGRSKGVQHGDPQVRGGRIVGIDQMLSGR